ncbi:LicD family-domain-containing protein [Hypomontagnella monticulosa]|nr:LicD family-domain-containing protein [Hypomontagnella monticulosa]
MHITLSLLFPILLLAAISSRAATAIPAIPANSHPGHKSTSHKKPSSSSKNAKDDDQPKYFYEAGGSLELGHYDARFFRGVVPYAEHGPALRRLIRSWLATAQELHIEDAWLAHGTLLGWWWNGRVMPWDYDLDVQMPTATLEYLGRFFNRTVHDYRFPVEEGEESGNRKMGVGAGGDIGSGAERGDGVIINAGGVGEGYGYVNKTYLLDVNPHYSDLGRGNGNNVIDARWIDVSTGLFVDITGLAERDPADRPGVWSCKNAHRYRTTELFPIRRTEFEGVPANIPYAFDKILTDEYGAKSLTGTEWAGHHWVPELKEWAKIPEEQPEGDETTLDTQQQDNNTVVVVVEKTVVKGSE